MDSLSWRAALRTRLCHAGWGGSRRTICTKVSDGGRDERQAHADRERATPLSLSSNRLLGAGRVGISSRPRPSARTRRAEGEGKASTTGWQSKIRRQLASWLRSHVLAGARSRSNHAVLEGWCGARSRMGESEVDQSSHGGSGPAGPLRDTRSSFQSGGTQLRGAKTMLQLARNSRCC